MKHKWLSYLICIAVQTMLLALAMSSCSTSPERKALRDAETIMEENPDSALMLLNSIAAGSLTDEGDRAKYNLLFCQANVKLHNWDLNLDSIKQAVSYFEAEKDATDLMKSRFYLGELYFMCDSFPQAMRNVITAYDLSKTLDDDYWHAKSSEKIGDLYMSYPNPDQALRYIEEGAIYYGKAGKVRNHRFALADLSYCLACLRKYRRSKMLVDSIYDIAVRCKDTDLEGYCLDNMVFQNMLTNNFAEGIKRYDELADVWGEENIPLETKMNKALLDIYANPSDSLLERITQIANLCGSIRQRAKIGFVESQYMEKFGDLNTKTNSQQNFLILQDSILSEGISNTVSLEERDYYASMAQDQIRRKHKIALISLLAVVAVLILSFLGYLFFSNSIKLKNIESKKKIDGIKSELDIKSEENLLLSNSIDEKERVIAELRLMLQEAERSNESDKMLTEELIYSVQDKWKMFSEIYESYFIHHNSPKTSSHIHDTYERFISKVKGKNFIRDLRMSVDKNMNNIVSRLQEQCPWIKPLDLDILIMTYAGIAPKAIGYLLNLNPKTIYNKRNELFSKIKDAGPDDADFFLMVQHRKSEQIQPEKIRSGKI